MKKMTHVLFTVALSALFSSSVNATTKVDAFLIGVKNNLYTYKVQIIPDSEYVLNIDNITSKNGVVYGVKEAEGATTAQEGFFVPTTGFKEILEGVFFLGKPVPKASTLYFNSKDQLKSLDFQAYLSNYKAYDADKGEFAETLGALKKVNIVDNGIHITGDEYKKYANLELTLSFNLPNGSDETEDSSLYSTGTYGQSLYLSIKNKDGSQVSEDQRKFVRTHVFFTNSDDQLISSRMNALQGSMANDIKNVAIADYNDDATQTVIDQAYGNTVHLNDQDFLSYSIYAIGDFNSGIQAHLNIEAGSGFSRSDYEIVSPVLSVSTKSDNANLNFAQIDRSQIPPMKSDSIRSKENAATVWSVKTSSGTGTVQFKSSPTDLYAYFINGLYEKTSDGLSRGVNLTGEYFMQKESMWHGPMQLKYCDPRDMSSIAIKSKAVPLFCSKPSFGFISHLNSQGQIVTQDAYSLVQKKTIEQPIEGEHLAPVIFATATTEHGELIGQNLSKNPTWTQYEVPVIPTNVEGLESDYRFMNYAIKNVKGLSMIFSGYVQMDGGVNNSDFSADETRDGIQNAFADDFYVEPDATVPNVSMWLAKSNRVRESGSATFHSITSYPEIFYTTQGYKNKNEIYFDGYLAQGVMNLSQEWALFSTTLPTKDVKQDKRSLSGRILLIPLSEPGNNNSLKEILKYNKDIVKNEYVSASVSTDQGTVRKDIFKPEANIYGNTPGVDGLGSMISYHGTSAFVPVDWS